MKDICDYLVGIAVGVRFRNNFSIEDRLGSIIDGLLYSKDSLLNAVTFPMTGTNLISKKLHNPQTGDSLIINCNNIVLDINFSENIPKEKARVLIDEFFKIITEKIYKIIDIHDVYLIGVVHKYIVTDEATAEPLYKRFKEITVDDAASISVSFTKKIFPAESKVSKEVNDHENVMCTIEMNKKSEYFFQVDYQHIFEPKLASIIDIPYKDFIEKVNYYNSSSISAWIKKYETKKTR
jgi:hypothetical protein